MLFFLFSRFFSGILSAEHQQPLKGDKMRKYFSDSIRLLLTAVSVFAAEISAAAETESAFGINAHWNVWERPEGELESLLSSGIVFLRSDLAWKQSQKPDGSWDFSVWDNLLPDSLAGGIEHVFVLGHYEKKYSPAHKNMEPYLEYVRKSVKHYGDRVRYWEVINEPNIQGDFPKGDVYGKFLGDTCREIKKINPDVTVLTGGIAGFQFKYMEEMINAAGKDGFDILNFHFYPWTTYPEVLFPAQLKKLHAMRKKLDIADKPVWMTETGYATGEFFDFTKLTEEVLKKIGMERSSLTIGLLNDDESRYYSEGVNLQREKFFPAGQNFRNLNMTELKDLRIDEVQVILLAAHENFPLKYAHDLADYVKRGGTVIFPATIPLYNNICPDKNGDIVLLGAGNIWRKLFHIGWNTFWTKDGIPRGSKHPTAADWLPTDTPFPQIHGTRCFLNADNLKPGDEMIPIVTGYSADKSFSAPIAAIYRLNSDFKGNVIVYAFETHHENTSPENQGKFVPRTNLVALGNGVDKVFWYRLRGNEFGKDEEGTRSRRHSRENHFGIVNKWFKIKPAHTAYAVLTRMYAPGSSKVQLSDNGKVWKAVWLKPNGETVTAVWTMRGTASAAVKIPGKLTEVCNHLGEPLELKAENGFCRFTATDSVTYFVSR